MHLTTSALITLSLALPSLTTASYHTPFERSLYARGHLSTSDMTALHHYRRSELLDRIRLSAAGGSQTMQMLTTTPQNNHILPAPLARGAGAVVGAAEALLFSNSRSAPPKPMKEVATTGKDRPVTKEQYINKATELAVETTKGPMGNGANEGSLATARKFGKGQGGFGYEAGTAFDKAVTAFKGAGEKAKAVKAVIKGNGNGNAVAGAGGKGKRDLFDFDGEDLVERDLFDFDGDEEGGVDVWARGWDDGEDEGEWY